MVVGMAEARWVRVCGMATAPNKHIQWAQMMRAEVTKYNKRFGVVKVAATGYVGPELVVEAELTLALGK
jgi:hypothetical protein